MIASLPATETGRVFKPADGLTIATERSIDRRLTAIRFSLGNFRDWVRGRGLSGSAPPLEIRLRGACKSDEIAADGRVTSGSFESDGRSHVINLYMGHLLADYDNDSMSYGGADAHTRLNYALNRTNVHELEHHIQTVTSGPLKDIRDEFITVAMNGLAREWRDSPPTDDLIAVQAIAEVMRAARTGASHQLYLDHPHEVRAREAANLFDSNPVPILAVDVC